MPVQNYSLLKGDPVSGKLAFGNSPHYQITVNTDDGQMVIAVNIQSVDDSQVLYTVDHAFVPPAPDLLAAAKSGVTPLDSAPGGLALDYVRSTVNGQPMVSKDAMQLLPKAYPAGARHNDLNNEVVDLLNRTVADPTGVLYAFGSSFSDGGVGIHDIHMNQGNPPHNHSGDNGTWQDGALFVNLPASNTWLAIFIAFQTQSWNTNDDGNVA